MEMKLTFFSHNQFLNFLKCESSFFYTSRIAYPHQTPKRILTSFPPLPIDIQISNEGILSSNGVKRDYSAGLRMNVTLFLIQKKVRLMNKDLIKSQEEEKNVFWIDGFDIF